MRCFAPVSTNLVRLRRHAADPLDHALARLERTMHEKRSLEPEDLRSIARATHQPEAAVFGVATFYSDLGVRRVGRTRVKVCKGTACHAASAGAPIGWFEAALGVREGETSADGAVSLEGVYCLGRCHASPAAQVEDAVHDRLTPASVAALAADLDRASRADAPPSAPECVVHGCPPVVLERLARGVDATRLGVARDHGVFGGLARALERSPAEVLGDIERSGLRGRGGAGFPTGTKLRLVAEHAGRAGRAYVVCNADEGDPGSYIDQAILERDPFAVLEGMAIAARAVGADQGVVYVRSEYPAAIAVLRAAVEAVRSAGWPGAGPGGSGFSFRVAIVVGAGSYVCGEETALLRSAEGQRGMVSARPPFPAERGLFGLPTVVNNVETLASLGWILRHGGAAYAALGTGRSRGTKAFSLNERFRRPGIYELELGTPARVLLEELGGGMQSGRPLKAFQIGGPLGGILTPAHLETPLGFEELEAVGGLLGHGSVVAWDADADLRSVAEHLLEFGEAESCGKCFPCRLGTRRALELVRGLAASPSRAAAEADLVLVEEICETMRLGSLCAHGGSLPAPIGAILREFRHELLRGVP